ncbi:MAG TPA: AAA family ATPase [Candidatus Sulfotelmatobacter sp.]|nr:AAA family ATPase [Candidatus Sulfotelmatobacter sp.]
MFLDYYGLREEPFGVTPDPRFLYLSPEHREALASIYYGIEAGRGFLALIAVPGMGKTTLLFHLLERFRSSARTAFLFQTQCTSREFMRFLLNDLSCESGQGQDPVAMHEEFNRLLLQEARAGRRCIVIVDEAHNLDLSVLETIRLLSDFETPQAKLLQIVLSGQPELASKLAQPSLAQLRQRISLIGRLGTLPPHETRKYLEYRLKVAGLSGQRIFTDEACEMIAELSLGIPRNINNLCFNALSLGFALRRKTIGVDIMREVAADFDLTRLVTQPTANRPQDVFMEEPQRPGSDWLRPESPEQRSVPSIPVNIAANSRGKEPLTLMEAKAYMQRISQLLRDDPRIPN